MNWRRWKLGCFVSLLMSIFVAGAGWGAGASLKVFFATFCAAAVTHFGAFISTHPPDQVEFDSKER